jgi:hypothetical protein
LINELMRFPMTTLIRGMNYSTWQISNSIIKYSIFIFRMIVEVVKCLISL